MDRKSSAKQRQCTDPGRTGLPQRRQPLEPFQVFCLERRDQVQSENRQLGPSEVTSVLSQMWRGMDQTMKQHYVAISKAYNRRYEDVKSGESQTSDMIPEIPRTQSWVKQGDLVESLPFLEVVARGDFGHSVVNASRSQWKATNCTGKKKC